MKLVQISNLGSSPVHDKEIIEAAKKCVPPPTKGETSLQKLDGTDIYMWHWRDGVYWYGDGHAMVIEKESSQSPLKGELYEQTI